jgi:hypothetical protein
MYHERLDRLERALGLAERSLAGPETFDSIWQWYVTRRNELRQQGEPVAASTAKP